MRPPRRADAVFGVRKRRWCPVGICSLELQQRSSPQIAGVGNQVLKASFGSEQQGFEAGTGSPLPSVPFLDRHQNGGFNSATGHHLWALLDGHIQELTKRHFRRLALATKPSFRPLLLPALAVRLGSGIVWRRARVVLTREGERPDVLPLLRPR